MNVYCVKEKRFHTQCDGEVKKLQPQKTVEDCLK